jgi:hypothetical protein
MDSELTQEEIALATKYIKRCGKSERSWVWTRWFFLLILIFWIGGSVYYISKANQVRDKNTSGYIFGTPNPKTDLLNKYIDARIGLLQLELDLRDKAMVGTILTAMFLFAVAVGWRQNERDKLMAKGLKILLAINKERASGETKEMARM